MEGFELRIGAPLSDPEINELFAASWPGHKARGFQPVLARSLAYVSARSGGRLVGFVNLAWDGGLHGFLLDTTVHPDFRRQGLGSALVEEAAKAARSAGLEWIHVDFEREFTDFYLSNGFRASLAGLRRLLDSDPL